MHFLEPLPNVVDATWQDLETKWRVAILIICGNRVYLLCQKVGTCIVLI